MTPVTNLRYGSPSLLHVFPSGMAGWSLLALFFHNKDKLMSPSAGNLFPMQQQAVGHVENLLKENIFELASSGTDTHTKMLPIVTDNKEEV